MIGGLAIIAGVLWMMGGQEMFWQTTSDMGTALFWIAGIALMYPFMLFVWVAELRDGLKAARNWQALSPEAQAAAIAETKAAQPVARQKQQARKKG